jgi:hypothetical protein
MALRRRALSILVAAVIALPLTASVGTRHVSAACYDTWTGLETDSSSGTYGIFRWSGSVTYKLKTNTCNLGVYTEIYVDHFVSRFHVNAPDPSYFYRTPFATILKDCKGHTNGCLTDQGESWPLLTRANTTGKEPPTCLPPVIASGIRRPTTRTARLLP